MKRIMKFIFIILLSSILFGCWDKNELNSIALSYVIALSKDDSTGSINCEMEIVNPNRSRNDTENSKEIIIKSKGKNVYEAICNTKKSFDREVSFSHNKIIMIEEGLAKEGMLPILDYFKRTYEVNSNQWILIYKSRDLNKILLEKQVDYIQGKYLEDIEKGKENAELVSTNLLQFFKQCLSPGIDPCTGILKTSKLNDNYVDNNVLIEGAAVISGDKFVGELNNREARGFNWCKGNFKFANINVSSLSDSSKYIALKVKYNKASIETKTVNDNVTFDINVKQILDIKEVSDDTEMNVDNFKDIEDKVKVLVEEDIRQCMDKCQKEYNSDILGFGNILSKKNATYWEKNKRKWKELYPSIGYNVNVEVTVEKSGLLQKMYKAK